LTTVLRVLSIKCFILVYADLLPTRRITE